jgi:ATP-dependent helicase HepA
MITHAEKLAAKLESSLIDTARTQMKNLQQSESERLQALAKVNPNIRQDEIDHLAAETDKLQHYLASAHLKLEAVRVAVITE